MILGQYTILDCSLKLMLKLKQSSTKLKLKRRGHYFFRGGWVEEWRMKLFQLKLELKLSLATKVTLVG